MSTIREYTGSSYYNDDYSWNKNNSNSFLSGLSVSADSSAFSLSDYAMIKNGSYGKLMKAYYAQEKTQKASVSNDSTQKIDSNGRRRRFIVQISAGSYAGFVVAEEDCHRKR